MNDPGDMWERGKMENNTEVTSSSSAVCSLSLHKQVTSICVEDDHWCAAMLGTCAGVHKPVACHLPLEVLQTAAELWTLKKRESLVTKWK